MLARHALRVVALVFLAAAISPQVFADAPPADGPGALPLSPAVGSWWSAGADEPTQPPRAWRVDFGAQPAPAISLPVGFDSSLMAEPAQRPRAVAFEYSDAYEVRRKIHVYASYATLPLVATEWVLGQKLYNFTGGPTVKTAHGVVAASLGVLFGVNTVTGVWNLWEARKDPNHRTKRTVHGILMLAADAGFMASGMTAPGHEFRDVQSWEAARRTHRDVSIGSLVTALAGYVIMLVGR